MRSRFVTGLLLFLSLCPCALAQDWKRLGPEGGMVVSLGAGPAGTLYLGTADGHVFASENGAQSWELRGRVGSRLDAVVTRVLADPHDGQRLFAAVWYQAADVGGGVFQSEDGGRTWSLMGLGDEEVRALELAPSEPEELVAGTRRGVFRSVDGGKNWARISPLGHPELRNVDSLAIDPRDPETIYVGTYHLPWRTNDGGKTWRPISAGIIDDSDIMSMRVDTSTPERLYMSACSGIYRSENRGNQWIKLQGVPYAARRTQVIVQDAAEPRIMYAGTTEGLWVTRDGGESWIRTTPRDWVVNSIVVLAAKGGETRRVVLGTEGQGVRISDDAGATFSEANRGFTHVVVKLLLSDPIQAGHLLLLTEQGGSRIEESWDEGKSWTPLPLPITEPGKVAKLSADQIHQVFSSPWGWLLQLVDGRLWIRDRTKQTWKQWSLKLPLANQHPAGSKASKPPKVRGIQSSVVWPPFAFSRDLAIIPSGEGLLRCLASGLCSRMKAFGRRGTISALWVSTTGSNIRMVKDGKLGSSSDGGETSSWQDLPVTAERVLWLDMVESSTMAAAYLGTATGLFVSLDGGVHWERVSGGLPGGRMDLWLRTPKYWLATEAGGGMYLSLDNGNSWERVDKDAQRGRFAGLVMMESGAVLAGSQSEGLLRLDLGVPKRSY